MFQRQFELRLATSGKGLTEITAPVKNWLSEINAQMGQITLFCRHTSCSLTIQENADPDVQKDLLEYFERLVPENQTWYRHIYEGADDMPAHIKSALTQVSLTIPVTTNGLALGTWQGIYLFEHRAAPHNRHILLHYLGV